MSLGTDTYAGTGTDKHTSVTVYLSCVCYCICRVLHTENIGRFGGNV